MKKPKEQSPFEQEITCAGKQLQAINASFEEMKRSLAYEKAFDFTDKVERLTLTARQLPAYTGHTDATGRSGICGTTIT